MTASACFDTYWRFAAARQDVFHRRAAGAPPPWTTDPVLARYRFTNVYRAADRVSQYLIRDVIYAGPQDPDEVVFRVLLCKIFNRIETWELLARYLGASPSWAGYSFSAYARILGEATGRGDPIYSAAYIMPNPPFGERRKHENHLRLLEHAMAGGLPAKVAAAGNLRAVYELLLSLPSIGPFLAYQYAVDLAYSPITGADETQFVVAGPGALDGISKCFTDTGGLAAADVITWMLDTSRDHFARLGLSFGDLWGRWPALSTGRTYSARSASTPASPTRTSRVCRPDPDQAGVPGVPPARSTIGSRRNGDSRPGGQPSPRTRNRPRERQRPRPQVPGSTPPPCRHTAPRHARPVTIACSHSSREHAATSSP